MTIKEKALSYFLSTHFVSIVYSKVQDSFETLNHILCQSKLNGMMGSSGLSILEGRQSN